MDEAFLARCNYILWLWAIITLFMCCNHIFWFIKNARRVIMFFTKKEEYYHYLTAEEARAKLVESQSEIANALTTRMENAIREAITEGKTKCSVVLSRSETMDIAEIVAHYEIMGYDVEAQENLKTKTKTLILSWEK